MRTLLTTIGALGFISCLIPAVAAADEAAPLAPPPSEAQAPGPSSTVSASMASGQGAPNLKGVSVWGILPWNGVGIGGRFMLPLPIQPVLHSPTVKDTFALEFGADFLHWSYGIPGATLDYSLNEIVPVAGMMWSLWFNDRFALYPKFEVGYAILWISGWNNSLYGPTPSYGAFFWDLAGGAMYKLGNGLTLRAEVGSADLKVGVGLLF